MIERDLVGNGNINDMIDQLNWRSEKNNGSGMRANLLYDIFTRCQLK